MPRPRAIPYLAAAVRELREEVGIDVEPGRARPAVALGDAARQRPPLRHALLRRRDARRRHGRAGPARGGRPPLADAARRARRDGRGCHRPLAAHEHDAPAAGARPRPRRRPPAPGARRAGRGSRDGAPVAGRRAAHVRRRRGDRRPVGRCLARRPSPCRRRRPGRPVGRGSGRHRRPSSPTPARPSPGSCSRRPSPTTPPAPRASRSATTRRSWPRPAPARVMSSEIVAIEDGDRLGLRRRRDPRPRHAGHASGPPRVRRAGGRRRARRGSRGPGPVALDPGARR